MRACMCRSARARCADGFTLIEVLVATALLTGAAVGVAQGAAMVVRSNIAARDVSYAGVLASQKLAELLADAGALMPTAPDGWAHATAGNIDFLDPAGAVVAAGGSLPDGAIYVRRWSITSLPGDPGGGLVVQVSAGRLRRSAGAGVLEDATPSEVARVIGVRTGVVP